MKLVTIEKNLKAQKNAQERVIKKGKKLLNAFLKKKPAPKNYVMVMALNSISILTGGCSVKI